MTGIGPSGVSAKEGRMFASSLFIAGWVAACAQRDHRKEELFASWQKAQNNLQSLVVEFTLETMDPLRGKGETRDGAFRLIRTPNGEVLASYEIVVKGNAHEKWSGLFHKDSFYLLNQGKRTAVRYELAGVDVQTVLEKICNPLVLLLDRKRAEEKWDIEVTKESEWYTYLAVKPKVVAVEPKAVPWMERLGRVLKEGLVLEEGQVVVMHADWGSVSKDMPRRLWFRGGFNNCSFEIRTWRMNAADPPKLEEFTKPEDRPGWKVVGTQSHSEK
jgi:hypothetical protein